MLKRLSPREILINLSNEWEATLAREWLDAIRAITSAVVLKDLVAELERGNIDGAVALLGIDAERFARFEGSLVQAYNAGGQAVVGSMPNLRNPDGNRVVFSWGVRNTPGEQILRNHAASLVDGLVGEQLDNVRLTLTNGLMRGQNPHQTARALVGTIDLRTKLRTGGLIGNTPSVVDRLDKLYLGLRSGDPEVMKVYLGYAWRNKQFEGHVKRALAEGRAVPVEAVDRIVKAYSNKALMERAKALALTETNIALTKAKTDAFQQQIDAGKLEAGDVTKTWGRSVSKEKRVDHLAMVGQTVPFSQLFTLPDGIQCTGPHDPNLPAHHLISCKCVVDLSVDFTAQALRRYRQRTGLE